MINEGKDQGEEKTHKSCLSITAVFDLSRKLQIYKVQMSSLKFVLGNLLTSVNHKS